jgi:ribosomal protein L24E
MDIVEQGNMFVGWSGRTLFMCVEKGTILLFLLGMKYVAPVAF